MYVRVGIRIRANVSTTFSISCALSRNTMKYKNIYKFGSRFFYYLLKSRCKKIWPMTKNLPLIDPLEEKEVCSWTFCIVAGPNPIPSPSTLQPQPQGLIVETSNGASVLQLPASTLEQIRHIASDPGASTLRLPPPASQPPAGSRELDFDLCYVCKHCKVAFPSPAPLQAHQARACYAGRETARGLIRVVQPALECRACVGERFRTVAEWRRHAESEAHARAAAPPSLMPSGQPEPLTHEMEDVVNQITLLAARAAQEVSPATDTNGSYCAPPGPRFPPPGELPLASAGH